MMDDFEPIFDRIVRAITYNIESADSDGFDATYSHCEQGIYSEDEDTYVISIRMDPIRLVDVIKLTESLNQVTYRETGPFVLTHFTYMNDSGDRQYWLEGRMNQQRIAIFIVDGGSSPENTEKWPDYELILRAAPKRVNPA